MPARSVITACTAIVLASSSTFGIRADDRTLLIELETRSGALPNAVSASGAVTVGGFDGGGAFYWMPTTGVVFAGGRTANSVSRDGHTIVGLASDASGIRQAAIWTRGTEWRLLGSFAGSAGPGDASLSRARGVSSDGRTVVGHASSGCVVTHAFRWQESGGMVDLGSTVEGRNSQGIGVSADGAVVVGIQTAVDGFNQGARWANGRQELITGPEGPAGSAMAANHDGSIVVGRVCVPASGRVGDQSAWIWTTRGGTTCLPAPRRLVSPGPPIVVEAAATSDDGQVIGGSQSVGSSPDSNAVVWIGGQPAYLKEFLQANGLPNAFRTWINTGTITGISPDGRVLVGWGAALGGFRGVQGARFFTPSWGAELLWTQQGSALELGTADGTADLFTMTVRQLHGNLMYRFGGAGARWQPFVFGGLGATFLSADTIKSETKLSLDVGGGLKYFPRARFGARTQIRYKPSLLNDSSSGDFCDPFGFCQGVLHQIEFTRRRGRAVLTVCRFRKGWVQSRAPRWASRKVE